MMSSGLGLLLSISRSSSLALSRRRFTSFSRLSTVFDRVRADNGGRLPGKRGFCGYAVEQFSDDEYECEFENQKASSSVANIDEWRWKLSLLLRSEEEQEIVSRDKRDRRDYEQISGLARRMGLHSELYGKVVVASKVPLPNYRPDLDDKRPQREVVIPLSLQRRVEGLLQEHLDRIGLVSEKAQDESVDQRVVDHADYKFLEENQEPLLDESMMEKVLQRKSSRMRNLQRAWEIWQFMGNREVWHPISWLDGKLTKCQLTHKGGLSGLLPGGLSFFAQAGEM